jgi:hypothetical protein
MAMFKKKEEIKQIGKPRKLAAPQIRGTKRAHRLPIAIGVDSDNQSHLLGKGPELNFMGLRDVMRTIRSTNGLTTVDGRDVQLTSAAILRPGQRSPKRYTFKPVKKAAKVAKKKLPAKKD